MLGAMSRRRRLYFARSHRETNWSIADCGRICYTMGVEA